MPIEGGKNPVTPNELSARALIVHGFLTETLEKIALHFGTNSPQWLSAAQLLIVQLNGLFTGEITAGYPAVKVITLDKNMYDPSQYNRTTEPDVDKFEAPHGWSVRVMSRDIKAKVPDDASEAIPQLRIFNAWVGNGAGKIWTDNHNGEFQQLKMQADYIRLFIAAVLSAGDQRRADYLKVVHGTSNYIQSAPTEDLAIQMETIYGHPSYKHPISKPQVIMRYITTIGGQRLLQFEGARPETDPETVTIELTQAPKNPLRALAKMIGNALDLKKK